jgi:hypothetical protein
MALSAAQVRKEKAWRFKYTKHYEALVRAAVGSKDAALQSSQAGLQWIYDNFEFIADGKVTKFGEAYAAAAAAGKTPFHTGVVKGTGAGVGTYRVPYDGGWHPSSPKPPAASAVLEGPALKKQLDQWVAKGVMERDAADAVAWCVKTRPPRVLLCVVVHVRETCCYVSMCVCVGRRTTSARRRTSATATSS